MRVGGACGHWAGVTFPKCKGAPLRFFPARTPTASVHSPCPRPSRPDLPHPALPVLQAAAQPELAIPETPSLRAARQYRRMLRRGLLFLGVGGSAVLGGYLIWRTYQQHAQPSGAAAAVASEAGSSSGGGGDGGGSAGGGE